MGAWNSWTFVQVFGHLWGPSQPHWDTFFSWYSSGAETEETWVWPGLGFGKDSKVKGEGARELLMFTRE